jgi:TPR repeat protein
MRNRENDNSALRWYRVAADGGYALAQDLLGFFYYEKSNFAEAVRWYEKAASHGYLPAIWRLGRMYKTGKGVSVNKEKSFSLFEQASQNGHVFSKRDLAVMLIGGHHGLKGIPIGVGLFIISVFQLIRIAITSKNDERIRN